MKQILMPQSITHKTKENSHDMDMACSLTEWRKSMSKDEIREMNARLAEFERAKKEFSETHKPAICMNPSCQREIQPGATINVVPFRDEIFCSAECLADYYGGYELEFDADDEDYASWFENRQRNNERR